MIGPTLGTFNDSDPRIDLMIARPHDRRCMTTAADHRERLHPERATSLLGIRAMGRIARGTPSTAFVMLACSQYPEVKCSVETRLGSDGAQRDVLRAAAREAPSSSSAICGAHRIARRPECTRHDHPTSGLRPIRTVPTPTERQWHDARAVSTRLYRRGKAA